MKKLLPVLTIAATLLLSHNVSKANKIMASDLTFRCVGQDSFFVTLTVYRDCNGDALNASPLIVSCAQSGVEITRITLSPGVPVDVTPICNNACTRCTSSNCSFPYGIHKYTMQGMVVLSGVGSCCNVRFSWEQCCRNTAITTGAAGANFYTEATLNRCLTPQDNSPSFTNMPIAIVCVGKDFTFSQGIQDIDLNITGGQADTFTFEWSSPLKSADSEITYSGSYSYSKPIYFWGFPNDALPFPRGIHLDPQSGHIQFRPMKAEVTVMSVKVNELRNSFPIAELQRNIEIIVISCLNNMPPTVSTPNNVKSKTVCAGDTVSFDFTTTDPDTADHVTISWDNSIPGASWWNTNTQTKHPVGKLIWIPSDAHVSSLPYTFKVTAKDDACHVSASTIIECSITVKPKPRANIIVIDSGGGEFWFIAQRIEGSGPGYMWEGENFTFIPNTGSMVWHTFLPGIYPYTRTMVAGGCTRTYYDTVFYDTTNNIIDTRKSLLILKTYPNPAKEFFNLLLEDPALQIDGFKLYSVLGELIKEVDMINSKEYQINCTGLEKGAYFIKIRLNNGIIVNQKLILQ